MHSSAPSSGSKPRIPLLAVFRLGLFQLGLGMMSVLFLGVLNRAMISNLGIPAVMAAVVIAMHQFVAPARVWFGQLSDARPLAGSHRTGYVWLGSLAFGLSAFLAVQLMWQLGQFVNPSGEWVWSGAALLWVILAGLGFALYGIALSASSTPFAALLVDVSEEDERPKLVGIIWSMLMVGIVVGAIIISVLLKQLTVDTPPDVFHAAINRVFLVVPLVVFGLGLISMVGIEKHYSRYGSRSQLVNREDQITLGRALRVLTASPQTGVFFTFLLMMTISLFMQDAVLEPYGDIVFGMPYSETTLLNAAWGTGTLIGIASTGFLLVPRLGKQGTTRCGCLAVAFCFGLMILAGIPAIPTLLKFVVFLFGLASGVTTTGAISLMLDLTAAETAGTFIGAWGLAQAWARALATVLGGSVLSVGRQWFDQPIFSFGLVFGLQMVGMVVAVLLLSRVNVEAFRHDTQQVITQVLAADLDS
ncbi:MAG: BCD family MFS transporter [Cyanobacteriota bacterium]|nr:BCD family MFS transporter [Cyanobacteriota bacterium]